MDPHYSAQVFLFVHLFFPSVILLFVLTCTQLTRILNFLSISHISMLVGNSINFPLSSHQQPGLSNLGIFTLKAPAQHGEYTGMSWQGARSMLSLSASIPFYIRPSGKLRCTFYLSSGPSAGKNIQSRVACCPPWPVLQCRATSGHGLRRTSSYCGCMFEIWPNFNTPKNWLSKDFTGHVVPETTTQVFQARIIRSRCFMCERYHRDVCQKCGSRISWMWLTAIVWHFEKCICLLAESWMRGLLPLISFALYRVRAEEAWKREAGLLREGGAAAPTTTRHYKNPSFDKKKKSGWCRFAAQKKEREREMSEKERA